jgi:hypothetical protein
VREHVPHADGRDLPHASHHGRKHHAAEKIHGEDEQRNKENQGQEFRRENLSEADRQRRKHE